MLALFHDKKCCNCINFIPCILWEFICNGFSTKWWRFDQDSEKSHEEHMPEVEESCKAVNITSVSRVRPSREILAKHFAWRFLSVTFLSFTHIICALITHINCKEAIQREKP